MANRNVLCPWAPRGRVLDACASTRKWWPTPYPADAIFMDLLPSVRPTVCGSFASLPFRDGVFDAVWWDPPHLIRNDTKNWNPLYARFGNYRNRREFEDLWIAAGAEFARVLRNSGELVVKYIYGKDYRVPDRDDICLLPLFREVERVERPSTVGWSTNTTAFVRMEAI